MRSLTMRVGALPFRALAPIVDAAATGCLTARAPGPPILARSSETEGLWLRSEKLGILLDFCRPEGRAVDELMDLMIRHRPSYIRALMDGISEEDTNLAGACLSLEQEWEERGVGWPS